ncbi:MULTISPECIES: hypothetical protein [Olivibacter]|uniref:Peptidase C51 domain-containing protein n=1 Tax=Olivibacter jilunii TaxID=985016 RepID=A0ABW6AWW1_9SPHI
MKVIACFLLLITIGCNSSDRNMFPAPKDSVPQVLTEPDTIMVIQVPLESVEDTIKFDTLTVEPEIAIPVITKRELVKSIYDSQVGVRELSGKNDGIEVEKYLKYVGLGRGYAWCAAFTCWVYGQAEVINPRSAWSPSMFPDGNVVYQKNLKNKQAIPQTGDTFGIWFNNLKRVAHVGFIDDWQQGSYIVTVEGNTNDIGSRDGDGVYRKRRLKSQIYQVSSFIE